VLTPIAHGVMVHTSEFLQSNAVVVQGGSGVLLVDPGVTRPEIACLAADLRALGQPVLAGFSTHPHWDHLLWDAALGTPPRYGTAGCAAAVRHRLSDAGAKERVASMLPPEYADQIGLDLLGDITGLSAEVTEIPWDGPTVRVLEHQGHAPGHAALLVDGVLVAGDLVSDVLVPLLGMGDTAAADYLDALRLLEGVAGDVQVFVPGHGSTGGATELRARIDQDRAFVNAFPDVQGLHDPRFDPSA
jgi:glyoxylase-like metal-dependent hydrolase (beta-lactamase superfamily II)